MFLRNVAVGLASVSVAMGVSAGSSAANVPARHVSSGDAGYGVSGPRFDTVETWVKLPKASEFAAEIGFLAVSVQFWTSKTVLDLKAVACTDSSCRPGGKPVVKKYRLEFDVYSRKTGALVCTSSGTSAQRCPNVPSSFTKVRFAPGQTVMLYLAYRVPWDFVFVGAEDTRTGESYNYPAAPDSGPIRPTKYFRQGRVVVELGASPWAPPTIRAPRSAVRLVSFDRPLPPPYAAEIGTLSGLAGGFAQAWWHHHALSAADPGSVPRTVAGPTALWDSGYGFTVYLRPRR